MGTPLEQVLYREFSLVGWLRFNPTATWLFLDDGSNPGNDWIDLFVLSWYSSGYFVFILLVIVLSIRL